MDKYTAGPWIFEYRDGNHPLNDQDRWGCDGLWAVEGGFILGSGQGWEGEYRPPNEANARLIAAAPDLLEALEGLLDCAIHGYDMPDDNHFALNARAAILKAKEKLFWCTAIDKIGDQ